MTNNKQQTAVELFAIALYEKGLLIGNGDWMQDILIEFKEIEKEQIIQAYSHGWHDGQDAIIMKIEHIDKGGDERGLKYYEQLQPNLGRCNPAG